MGNSSVMPRKESEDTMWSEIPSLDISSKSGVAEDETAEMVNRRVGARQWSGVVTWMEWRGQNPMEVDEVRKRRFAAI